MVDQLQNHSGPFKKVPPISLYPQQIPGCSRKRQHEARIVPGSVPGVRLCGEFLREEDLSLLEDDFVRDKVENNKRFLFKKRVSTLC